MDQKVVFFFFFPWTMSGVIEFPCNNAIAELQQVVHYRHVFFGTKFRWFWLTYCLIWLQCTRPNCHTMVCAWFWPPNAYGGQDKKQLEKNLAFARAVHIFDIFRKHNSIFLPLFFSYMKTQPRSTAHNVCAGNSIVDRKCS